MLIESIGIIASIIFIVSFTYSDETKMRSINLIGGMIFLAYGVLIHSFSTVLLQTVMAGIHIYKIYKIKKGVQCKKNIA